MSYKLIRYRKRLFCELGQLFAGYVEYSKQTCRKVMFQKKISFCKQPFANKPISTACGGSIFLKIPKISAKIADCHNMTYEEYIFAREHITSPFFACRRIGVEDE